MRHPKKESIFVKTFEKSAVSMLIPLLLISACVMFFDINQFLNRLGEANVNILAKGDQVVTYMLEDLGRSMNNLAKDPTVMDFSMRPYLKDTGRSTNLCSLLDNLVKVYPYVESCSLYSLYENLHLQSSGQIIYGEPDWTLNSWTPLKKSNLSVYINESWENGRKLYLSIAIPASSAAPVATATLQIDLQAFMATAVSNAENGKYGRTYILDAQGNPLFTALRLESEFSSEIPQKLLHSNRTSSLFLLGNSLMLCSTFKGEVLNWQYIHITPALSDNNSLIPILVPLLMSVLAACVVGLLMAYHSSAELYRPLEKLIAALPESAKVRSSTQNEYQKLENYYRELIMQRESVSKQVNTIKPLLMKKFLLSLLDAQEGNKEDLHYQAGILGFPLQGAFYCASLVQIDNYTQLPNKKEDLADIKSQIDELIASCANEGVVSVSTEIDDRTFLVICNDDPAETLETAHQSLRTIAEEVKSEVESRWDLTVTMGIGGSAKTLDELPRSCSEAKIALGYKLFRGDGSIIDFSEIQEFSRQTHHYDLEKAQQLFNSVRTGDERNTRRLIKQIFEELANPEQFTPVKIREILRYLSNALQDILQSTGLADKTGITGDLEVDFTRKETLADIETWLMDLYCRTAVSVRTGGAGKAQQNAKQIKEYIDANLTRDISLTSISEHVNYSPAYVSKVFRQFYGTSYIDYLNTNRICLSQTLLIRTDASVKEVCFQVGFNNLQSFFRVFKKYTGMTPLQYRESHGLENEVP